jgi:hypothetical protein
MRNYVQVSIPEKLYTVILEICKIEPGVKTDRLLPEDLIEQCISSELADKLDTYVRDPEGCKVGEKAIYANIAYKEEWWKDHKEKYPSKEFLCIWDAIFPEDEEETE